LKSFTELVEQDNHMQMTSKKLSTAACDICQQNAESRHKRISDMAYRIFLEEGSPGGRMTEHWREAEQELMLVEKECHPMPCGCGHSTNSEHAK
jgi:hypothetical protein